MENQTVLKDSINQLLREKLESFGCITGRFECSIQMDLNIRISMSSINESTGKTVIFGEWEKSFKEILQNYLESYSPKLVSCIVEINIANDTYQYECLNGDEYIAKLTKQREIREQEEKERQLNHKKILASETSLYGIILAEKIADAFKPGIYISYSHRDYCGMGLGMNYNNEYVYGAVWDSWLNEDKVFKTKVEFVDWLSLQSDASLANLDGDPFLWGNQVITRKRLEEFLDRGV